MPRRRKIDAEKTRSRILASALALFVKKGYERTSVTDIAARLKMTKGAVYWHFESKEALLEELNRLAVERFREQLDRRLPDEEPTFPAIAAILIENAEALVADEKATAFFRLMKCHIRWSDASLGSVRDSLLKAMQGGPREILSGAIERDIAAGRVRPDVDPVETATIAFAVWEGLVQRQIDGFLECNLKHALERAYGAIWADIKERRHE